MLDVHGVRIPEGNDFPAIRHTIDREMGWVDRDVANSMFATGHDDRSNGNWTYLAHALTKPFDEAFDWSIDNPEKVGPAVAGGVALAAALPASVLAAAGLGYGLYDAGGGAFDYFTAPNRDREVEAIYRFGRGATAVLPSYGSARVGALSARQRLLHPDLPNGVDPRWFPRRAAERVLGMGVKSQDIGRSYDVKANMPPVVYRVSYYAPRGGRQEYATSDWGAAQRRLRGTPGALLYTGRPVEGAQAFRIEGLENIRDPSSYFVRGYRWTYEP